MSRLGKGMLIFFAILSVALVYTGIERQQAKARIRFNEKQVAAAQEREEREFPVWYPVDDSPSILDIVYLDTEEEVYHRTIRCATLDQLLGYDFRDILDGKHTVEMYLYEAGIRGFIPCPECYDSYGLLRSIYDELK